MLCKTDYRTISQTIMCNRYNRCQQGFAKIGVWGFHTSHFSPKSSVFGFRQKQVPGTSFVSNPGKFCSFSVRVFCYTPNQTVLRHITGCQLPITFQKLSLEEIRQILIYNYSEGNRFCNAQLPLLTNNLHFSLSFIFTLLPSQGMVVTPEFKTDGRHSN